MKIFVYGTLKNGFTFHDEYLGNGNAQFLGTATAGPEYSLYVGAQPHLVRESNDGHTVEGELYEIEKELLPKLDNLEGHPVVYKREIIETLSSDGQRTLAWAYLRPTNFKDKKLCSKEKKYV
jgi:gamma-glutamylaminecyclotransferase